MACGGVGCSKLPGGVRGCCADAITKSGRSCGAYDPPCVMTFGPQNLRRAYNISEIIHITKTGRPCGTYDPPCVMTLGPPKLRPRNNISASSSETTSGAHHKADDQYRMRSNTRNNTQLLERCAGNGTVVGTVASASFARQMLGLAASAKRLGFGCIAVSAIGSFPALRDPRVQVLRSLNRSDDHDMLPRPRWCSRSTSPTASATSVAAWGDVGLYGWRRSGLFRTRLWQLVLESGFNIFAGDCDWAFAWNPMPYMERMGGIDLVAVHDGPFSHLLNVGLMWIRSTPATREAAAYAMNRSWGGWDQVTLNLGFAIRTHDFIPLCSHSVEYFVDLLL